MARCETCGTQLEDASQRFCGGDRCRAVFMKQPTPRTPGSGPGGAAAAYGVAPPGALRIVNRPEGRTT
jgi:hypothetical protein